MNEPTKGSVVVLNGVTGTAYQRHHSDGLWHSTTGQTAAWDDFQELDPLVVYAAPERAHDGHDIRYAEIGVIREFPAFITREGDVKIDPDPEKVEIDFMVDTRTNVYCATCDVQLTPENAPLSDDWQVL